MTTVTQFVVAIAEATETHNDHALREIIKDVENSVLHNDDKIALLDLVEQIEVNLI